MATAKVAAATQRQTPFWATSPGASSRRNQTKNGTITIRSIVRMLGRFQIPGADPALFASALVTFLGYRPVSDQASSEPPSSSSGPEPPPAPPAPAPSAPS